MKFMLLYRATVNESLKAVDITELWAELSEAANTDPEASAFLAMFEPWAKARLDKGIS